MGRDGGKEAQGWGEQSPGGTLSWGQEDRNAAVMWLTPPLHICHIVFLFCSLTRSLSSLYAQRVGAKEEKKGENWVVSGCKDVDERDEKGGG